MAKSTAQPPNCPPLSSGLDEINARKQAEEVLLKAGALQNTIFNSANFSSIATDAKGVIQIFNVGAERMLGYTAADVMNKLTPADISDPQEVAARAEALSAELGTPIAPGFEALVFKASRGIEDIYELTYIRKDGSRFPAVVSVTALRDAQNEIIGYLLIGTDNTARKQAEEALLNSETQLKTVVENITEGIAVSDLDGQLLHFNRAALDLHGFTTLKECRQHLIKFADTFELSALDDTVWTLDQWPLARVLRGENLRDMEVRVRHIQAGWQRVFNYGGTLVRDADGQPLMAVVTISDITERKRADEALRASEAFKSSMIESSNDCIKVVDREGVLKYMSPSGQRLLEIEDINKYLGKSWIEFWNGEDRKAAREAVSKAGQGEIGNFQGYSPTERGTPKWWDIIITPIRGADGTVDTLLAVSRDITERKQAEAKILATQAELQGLLDAANQSHRATLSVVEDQRRAEESLRQLNAELENKVAARTADLEHARHDAEAANQAKSAFLAAMSHEIRTPMNGVIGMLDVLQQSSLNGSQMETTNIIHDSAFALLTIIDDILDFSKIEAGKLQIDYAPMNITGVVEGTCETLIPLALKKGVELTLFTDPAIPAAVMGDAGRLRQILVNLANNAIKFSSGQDRQGKVSVRAVLVEDDSPLTVRPDPSAALRTEGLVEGLGGSTGSPRTGKGDLEQVTLEFRVTDNGIGIDEATQARLFTPFIQADTSITRNFGGTGLGLVIARQLANIMGGEITMHSEPGKGSMFSVRLPFKLLAEQIDVGRVLTRHHHHVGLKPEEHMGGYPPDLQNPELVAELSCLVVGSAESLADDLAAYLVHDGAVVEQAADIAAAQQWISNRPPGLCIVVIDTEGVNSSLDDLRAAARARPDMEARFVVIGRGGRRQCRVVAADHVALDAEVMHRRAFLQAVAIAAGRAKQPDRESLPGDIKATITPLSREDARRQGSLILIAEDNEINQKVLLQQLRLLGRTADIASDGREALERWQSGDYALLFTDLHMPEMDGYELAAAIRAAETTKPRIPIIAITANALKGEADHCRAIGMDDYLSKPVQLVNLKAMLEKWLPVVSSDPIVDEAAIPEGVGRALPADEKTCRAEPDLQRQGNITVDVNVLKTLVGDDEAMIREFLHDFRLSAAKIAAELRAACAAGQAAAAGALAHKLKSSARSVGALALGDLCAAMEKAGKDGDTTELAALLPRFEQELAGVDSYLEGY